MNRESLLTEIDHSTAMLRAVFSQYATASACDRDWLRTDAIFWAGNRARCRAWLAGIGT